MSDMPSVTALSAAPKPRDAKSVVEHIVQTRHERRLLVSDAAREAGVAVSYWSDIEAGRKCPNSLDQLQKLARGVGIEILVSFGSVG